MNTPASLREQQLAFARHVRDGQYAEFAGIEPRRMAIYQRLVRGNLEALLQANFPVIHRTLEVSQWNALIEGFLRWHRSETPLFTAIAEEFIGWLESRVDPADPPWLAELAHWEWLELAAHTASMAEASSTGDLHADIPVIDPSVRIAAYAWPVHRIGPGFRPSVAPAQPTLLMVRRDASGTVRFSELSPLVFQLIAWMKGDPPQAGGDLLRRLADASGTPDRDAFLHDARAMLQRLRDEGVIVALRPRNASG